jgi:hypothetical protein
MLITNSLGRGELFVCEQSDLTTILSDAAIDGCQDFFSGKLVFTETETTMPLAAFKNDINIIIGYYLSIYVSHINALYVCPGGTSGFQLI